MSRFNIQSFLFAFALLASVLIASDRGSRDIIEAPHITDITQTSLAEVGSQVTYGAYTSQSTETQKKNIETSVRAPAEVSGTYFPDPSSLSLSAESVLVKEIGTPGIIYAIHPDIIWPLASLSKLMTVLVAEDVLASPKPIVITPAVVGAPGASGFFGLGETFTKEDMMRAALGISSNDAAEALARAVGYEKFIARMNGQAYALGMSHTLFFDPSGISPLNHGTANDLALLVEHILQVRPELLTVTRIPSFTITNQASGAVRALKNNNIFAGKSWFLGGKTGYTGEARGNLISIVEISQRKFLIIVLGTNDRFGETEKIISWLTAGTL